MIIFAVSVGVTVVGAGFTLVNVLAAIAFACEALITYTFKAAIFIKASAIGIAIM